MICAQKYKKNDIEMKPCTPWEFSPIFVITRKLKKKNIFQDFLRTSTILELIL